MVRGVVRSILKGRGSKRRISLQRGVNAVLCSAYPAIATSANLSVEVLGSDYFNVGNNCRIRQTGEITKVQFYFGGTGSPASVIIQFWKKNGTTYDLRAATANIASLVTPGTTNLIELASPISVQKGDFVSIYSTRGSNTGTAIAGILGYPENSNRYVNGSYPQGTGYDWGAKTGGAWIVPIKCYMRCPLMVAIGDSIVAGHPGNYTFVEASFVSDFTSSIDYYLELLDAKYIIQNMAIGSKTSTQIAARFSADVVNLKPKVVLINGGVNDIAGGTITKETFLTNYTTMLNLCRANNIAPIVMKILPWTNGTNEQMQTRDDWCASLKLLVESYSGAIYVDLDQTVGQNRATGDAGNLWDIRTVYNSDGVHFNAAGYSAMAVKINSEFKKEYRLV